MKTAICPNAAKAVVDTFRSERQLGAHCVISVFPPHVLAARILLQMRKFLRRGAAEKPVIHASRSKNNTLKANMRTKPTSA